MKRAVFFYMHLTFEQINFGEELGEEISFNDTEYCFGHERSRLKLMYCDELPCRGKKPCFRYEGVYNLNVALA